LGNCTVHPQGINDSEHVGDDTRIWAFAHVMKGARIGAHCNIGEGAYIEGGAVLGDYVTVKNGVCVWDLVTCENYVFLGPNAVLTNDPVPRSHPDYKGHPEKWRPTRLGEGATVGANATIVCGHTLGEYCFIAAGAVVTADVPAYALMAGVPARRIGWMSAAGRKLGPDLVCPETGSRYSEISETQLEPVTS
jgi:UDP-2-acetamido-3-amino-2,3-dideoxy-glucuronate N-acetyltransferase